MDPVSTRVARRFKAETKVLDLEWVEGLRKDFLTLLKNTDRVRTYTDLQKFVLALRTYRGNFRYLMLDRFLEKDVKNRAEMGDSNAKWIISKVRGPAWEFHSELSLPWDTHATKYYSEESCVSQFHYRAAKWKARVQRYARVFWAEMRGVIEWYSKYKEKPEAGPSVTVPERLQTTLEGFKVILHGYDIGYESERTLEKFKEGLRLYRQRASEVAPILLRKQLPIIVEFEATIDQGGEYTSDHVTFYASSVSGEDYRWVTHVMAHEMGHHLFKTYLSTEAQNFWMQTIRGDFGDIDLKELLDKWPGDAWAYEMHRHMPDDPILALQIEAFTHESRTNSGYQSKKDFQALYDKGVRTLRVPKTPITGYANKNSEEAFCEALGRLVAYGPRALHERVRWWLRTVLGNDVKVARAETSVV